MLDLEAIERIKQLKARYFRYLDTKDLEGLQSVFTEDASVDYQSPTYQIQLTGWPALAEFFAEAFNEQQYGMHNAHHPEIEVEGTSATGLWYLHDLFIHEGAKMLLQGSALYEDRYVKQGGVWLIQHSGYERLLEMAAPLPADSHISCRPIGVVTPRPPRSG